MKPAITHPTASRDATPHRRRGSHHVLAIPRLLRTFTLSAAVLLLPLPLLAGPAQASHGQIAVLEDDGGLLVDPGGTMAKFRQLGVAEARVYVEWSYVAPDPYSFTKPSNFDSASPGGYSWSRYDNIVIAARANHIKLDFLLSGGAPHWAAGPGGPGPAYEIHHAWKPSVTEWGNFVHAALVRFGGSVHTWEIFNEPNFGKSLGPQSVHGVATGPAMYRQLVDAAWRAFAATHHTHDTIVIGQVTARGLSGGSLPGNFSQTKPLIFLKDLYCVDNSLRPLHGSAAAVTGCPTTAAASRSFPQLHPGLFRTSGLGIHPYPQGLPPTRDASHDPNYITFNTIPRLEGTLDRIDGAYRSRGGLPLYNNEYGYVTHPPARNGIFASPANAAVYLNQAEYLSWLDPRIQSTMQYLLNDPNLGGPSQFFSGIVDPNRIPKATYFAYRMPLWLPHPTGHPGHGIEVWGDVRPANSFGGQQAAHLQWRRDSHVKFENIAAIPIRARNGYYDVRVVFPPGNGQLQVVWGEPGVGQIYSRTATVSVH